jgi:hypothetical protein
MATNILHHPSLPPRIPAVARILSQFDRPKLEGFIAVAIELLDVVDGDPDLESDPCNEGEPEFDPQSRELVNAHPNTDPNSDAEQSAWVERLDQTKPALTHPSGYLQADEDAEDDDGDGDCTDDEPAFSAAQRRIANAGGNGPGCTISDPDAEHDGAERETWGHWLDHPAELHRGKRSGWNDGPEAA